MVQSVSDSFFKTMEEWIWLPNITTSEEVPPTVIVRVLLSSFFPAGLSQLNSATWGQTHTDQSYWYAASLFLKATWMVKCPNWLGLPADLTSKSDSGTCTLLKAGMPPQEVANWNLTPPLWQKITTDHCRQIPPQNCWKPNSEQTREKKRLKSSRKCSLP